MIEDGDLQDLGHEWADEEADRAIRAAHERTLADIREGRSRFELDLGLRAHQRLNAHPEPDPAPLPPVTAGYAPDRERDEMRPGEDPRITETDVDWPMRPGPDFPGWRGSAA